MKSKNGTIFPSAPNHTLPKPLMPERKKSSSDHNVLLAGCSQLSPENCR